MAQLSDDCFAFGGKLLNVDAAIGVIGAEIGCVEGVEEVALGAADGRVLAEDVAAASDLPPFDNSAVDGYAVRLADLRDGGSLALAGRRAAGDPGQQELAPATAWRIFTGALLPQGADTVFMQEDVRAGEHGLIAFPSGLRRGANTRRRGEDIAAGSCALPAGRRLRPQDLALAAALGLRALPVRRAVRVALFSTGDELLEPGQPAAAARRYDANRTLLTAMLRRAGAVVTDLGILPDRRDAVEAALSAASGGHDLLITSGGISTGEEDHVKAAVGALGRLAFWRLAIKPGRPVAMGSIAGVPFVGLPGNPVAAFVTFAFIARPMLAALSGARPLAPRALPVVSGFAYRKKIGRREYVRVRLARAPDGGLLAETHPVEGAGILTSLTETDGLAELAETVSEVAPGDRIGFLPYEALL